MKLNNKVILILLASMTTIFPLMSKDKVQVKLSMGANPFSHSYKVDSLVVTGEYMESDLFYKMKTYDSEEEALLQVKYLDMSNLLIINENYDIGEYVIDNYAFRDCRTLRHIVFPKNLTTIGSHLFEECPNLHTIVLPDSLRDIRPMALVNCPTLQNVSISPSNKFYSTHNNSLFDKNKNRLFFVPPVSTGDYTLPSQISYVEDAAFYGCNKIKTVKMSSTLKSIGDLAFYRCSALSLVDIPTTVERIGSFAFFKCVSLKTIRMPKNLKTAGKFVFSGCEGLETVRIETEQLRNDYLFAGCYKLMSFDVNEDNFSLSAKEGVLFDKKKKVLIAYSNAKGSIYEVPMSVERIGGCSFYDCIGLKNIVLPSQLKMIERAAFSNCKNLEVIKISAVIPPSVQESSFAMVNKKKCVLYVPNNSLKTYRDHPIWGTFDNIVGF